jgi:hypothetical protein
VVEIVAVAALGIFVIGVTVGIIAVVSLGIRKETRRFQQERRFREENGIWGSPDEPVHYLPEGPHDGVSSVSRSVNGLYVRHLPPAVRVDADLGLRG